VSGSMNMREALERFGEVARARRRSLPSIREWTPRRADHARWRVRLEKELGFDAGQAERLERWLYADWVAGVREAPGTPDLDEFAEGWCRALVARRKTDFDATLARFLANDPPPASIARGDHRRRLR
jgi:hypothetical protein